MDATLHHWVHHRGVDGGGSTCETTHAVTEHQIAAAVKPVIGGHHTLTTIVRSTAHAAETKKAGLITVGLDEGRVDLDDGLETGDGDDVGLGNDVGDRSSGDGSGRGGLVTGAS